MSFIFVNLKKNHAINSNLYICKYVSYVSMDTRKRRKHNDD